MRRGPGNHNSRVESERRGEGEPTGSPSHVYVQSGKAAVELDRLTRNPEVMSGKPCLRGMRVTVGAIVGLVASGHTNAEILAAYPYLEEEDIRQALA